MFPSPGLVKTDRPDGGPVTVQIGRKREGGRERREREGGRGVKIIYHFIQLMK